MSSLPPKTGSGAREDPTDRHDAMARLLPLYEAGSLDRESRDAFEAHAVACDACFEELERGAAVSATLHAHRARFADLLASGVAGAPRGGAAMPRVAGRRFEWLRRPRVTLACAAILVAVLAVTLRVRDSARDPRRWASFSLDEIASEAVRAPSGDSAVQELIDAGLAHLELGHYEEADRRFRAALERDPAEARASYLLGLSEALAGRADEAIAHLERAASLATPKLRPAAMWTLANAQLASGRVDAARASLAEVAAHGEEPYAAKARALLDTLGPAP
jgi:tetratricopeptide (TPR) repeat protein